MIQMEALFGGQAHKRPRVASFQSSLMACGDPETAQKIRGFRTARLIILKKPTKSEQNSAFIVPIVTEDRLAHRLVNGSFKSF